MAKLPVNVYDTAGETLTSLWLMGKAGQYMRAKADAGNVGGLMV